MNFNLILIILLSGCVASKKTKEVITLKEVRSGKDIHKAILEEPLKFFDRRMANDEYYKLQGNKCVILLITDEFVYYGYPYGTGEDEFVNRLYMVSKKKISTIFPKFEEIEGYHVRRKAYEYAIKGKEVENYTMLHYTIEYDFVLEENNLVVDIHYSSKSDKVVKYELHYIVCMDKDDLSLINIKEVIDGATTPDKFCK